MTHTHAEQARDQDALAGLREEFPGWWVGLSEGRIRWDAKRRRGVFWTGGVWAIEAESAEMLRELLLETQIIDARHAGAAGAAATPPAPEIREAWS